MMCYKCVLMLNWGMELMDWWCANVLDSGSLSPIGLNEYKLSYITPINVRPIEDET